MFTNYYKPVNKLQGDFNVEERKNVQKEEICVTLLSLFDTE